MGASSSFSLLLERQSRVAQLLACKTDLACRATSSGLTGSPVAQKCDDGGKGGSINFQEPLRSDSMSLHAKSDT